MEKWKIIDDIEEIQEQVDKMGFAGSNEKELWTRDLIADYIVKKLNIPVVVGQSEQLKCECKRATFTRTVDEDFNPMCGKCGRTL